MIISHSKKFIFVHIQKTAGTSITRHLDKYITYQDLLLGGTEFGEKLNKLYKERFNLHKHSYAQKIKEIMGEDVWNDYFSFSFVRNPYDRAVSLYNWCRKGNFDFPICQEAINAKDFSQFIRGKCFKKLPNQLEYLTDKKENIIVNFIGRQESIQDDFDSICTRIDIPTIDMRKFKYNVRNRAFNSYQDYYSSENDIKIVKSQFADDLAFFNYNF